MSMYVGVSSIEINTEVNVVQYIVNVIIYWIFKFSYQWRQNVKMYSSISEKIVEVYTLMCLMGYIQFCLFCCMGVKLGRCH
jgi:hypothetical protein